MTKTYLGNYKIENLKDIIEDNSFKKVFLVTNKNSFINAGISDYIYQNLVSCQYKRFIDFSVNPKLEEIDLGVQEVQSFKPDLIIGIGGGSAMDMAKLIHFHYSKKIKLMCIPTTSGSGSEATQFAVYYKNGIKQSLDDIQILPDFTIVDGLLSESLPKKITAFTGVDAISQAIESYWSVASSDESKDFALKALELLVPSIINTVKNPNLSNREKMAIGAYYAGKAINLTRTTAPHAFSYYLTSKYNYPHGHAVGLVLPYFIKANSKKINLKPICEIFKVKDTNELILSFQQIMKSIELENDLFTILKTDMAEFINSVDPKRLANNPVILTKDQFEDLFTQKLV